jgi:calcineurin-like phosphoesterase family protein
MRGVPMPCCHPDITEHDRALIQNWNDRVQPDDTVYHLGDFAFGTPAQISDYAKQLNGHKVLIRGNHDRLSDDAYSAMGFLVRRKMVLRTSKGLEFRVTHFPPTYVDIVGLALCGHVHGSWPARAYETKPTARYINVGVDVRDYAPVRLTDIGLE